MKKIFLIILLAAAFVNLQAQEAPSEKDLAKHRKKVEKSKENKSTIFSLDTIFVAGAPYAVLKDVLNESNMYDDYDVYSLDGKLLMGVRVEYRNVLQNWEVSKRSYYMFIFPNYKDKGELETTMLAKIYEKIADNKLIKGNAIDPEAAAKFMKEHPATSNRPGVVVLNNKKNAGEEQSTANVSPMVARNRNAPVMLAGKDIMQDNTLIGKYTETREGGRSVITIYHPDGTKLAEAAAEPTTHNWNIFPMKDLHKYTVVSSLGKDAKDIIDFLVTTSYL